MKKTIYFITLLILSSFLHAHEMTGKIYQYIGAPPWAMSTILFDTTKPFYDIVPFDDVEMKLVVNYSRFAEDGRGEGYAEVPAEFNNDGEFIIDLSSFDDGANIAIVAVKPGYIKLWHIFKFCKSCDYTNMKAIFVKIQNYQKDK